MREAGGALVALVGYLGEQLEDDVGDHAGQRRAQRVGRRGRARHVAVHPADGVVGLEGQAAGEQLVEGDAERVEIRAAVDRPVHPPGLLRGHVRQRALDQPGGPRGGLLAGDTRGGAEVGDLDLVGVGSKRMLLGLRSLWIRPRPWMSATAVATFTASGRKTPSGIGLAREPVERVAVKVLQLEGRQALVAGERQRLDDRQALERPSELVLIAQPIDVPWTGVLRIEHLENDDPSVSHPLRSVQGRSLTLLQPLPKCVCLRGAHLSGRLHLGRASPCLFSPFYFGSPTCSIQTNLWQPSSDGVRQKAQPRLSLVCKMRPLI